MEIKKDIIFTDKDLELLKNILPDNPCNECDAAIRQYCCGCQKNTDYNACIKQYKDNNIYDIALNIKEVYDIKKMIKEMEDKQQEILNKIPEGIRHIIIYK